MNYHFCPFCGAEFDSEGGETCRSCSEYIPPISGNPKNPVVAALLTTFLPGLGQIYNGDSFIKGSLFFLGFSAGILLFLLPGILIWIIAIYDAYATANKINKGELKFLETDNRMIALFIILVIIVGACMIALTLFMITFAISHGMNDMMPTEAKEILLILGYDGV